MSSTASNQSTQIATNNPDPAQDTPSYERELGYRQTILCSAIIGIAGGLVATGYYYVLEGSLHLVWHTLPQFLAPYFPTAIPPGTMCGLLLPLVGFSSV